jgi:uncharacterized cofD-like protein
MNKSTKPKVVIIGGGTGTYVVGTGLKKYDLDLTAIVTVADSGGSTGRLRDEFGFQPVGDLRQALAAFSENDQHSWIRKLLLYRFDKGSGIQGHNLGNLILTALQDMTNTTAEAIEVASQVFRLKGNIFPITTDNIQLVIEYQDGSVVVGEHYLDESKHAGKKIVNIKTSPKASIYSKAKAAIEQADFIIVGPGDLYGSILPNFVVGGTTRAIARSNAILVYNANLMSKYAQTHRMSITDHLSQIEKRMKRKFDVVIINNQVLPQRILDYYRGENEYPLTNDVSVSDYRVIEAPLISGKIVTPHSKDKVLRSYLRHDSDKIARVILNQVIES